MEKFLEMKVAVCNFLDIIRGTFPRECMAFITNLIIINGTATLDLANH